MIYIIVFLSWTLLLYWMHRLAHTVSFLQYYHADHHKQVAFDTVQGFQWNNLLLFVDSWKSTVDQWLTEVFPTILFAIITGHWWIAVFYYFWAAFVQESIEHNSKFNIYPILTSGKWHLIHHTQPTKNFGVFFPIWDIIFGTRKQLEDVDKTQSQW